MGPTVHENSYRINKRVGHIMRLLPSNYPMISDLAPLRISIWCTMCDHALTLMTIGVALNFLEVKNTLNMIFRV